MTEPLALVFYQKLIPGQQLIHRLDNLGYRTHAVTNASVLQAEVQSRMPMVLIAEFPPDHSAVRESFASIKQNSSTAHIPILAYAADTTPALQEKARSAGASLIAGETGLLDQLPHLLEQVLQVD